MLNINDNFVNNQILFFKVYRNKYLNHLIFSNLALYREYNSIEIGSDPKEIIKYKEFFDYISKIKYKGSKILPLQNYSLPSLKTFEVGNFNFGFSMPDNEEISILKQIDPNSLPNTVEKVIFPNLRNINNVNLKDFPKSVTTFENLSFRNKYEIKIPANVTSLTFNSWFNRKIKKNVLPQSLTFLDLGKRWRNDCNQLKKNILPQSIKTLKLGKLSCYSSVDVLPKSLTDLTISHLKFTSDLLPKTLKKLTISRTNEDFHFKSTSFYTLTIDTFTIKSKSLCLELNSIPQSVTKLDIDVESIHCLYKDMLPKSLKSLKIRVHHESFKILKGSLPEGLIELDCLENGLNNIEEGLFPISLKSLSLGRINKKGFNNIIKENFLPKYLNTLNLGIFNRHIQPINSSDNITFINDSLPNSLINLNFGLVFNKLILSNSLPTHLERITFSPLFNQKLLVNSFPSKLVHLEFGNNFNNQIPVNVLPQTLKVLIFGNRFNQILLEGSLPSSISTLKFGSKNDFSKGSFNSPINENVLPSSLIHLELNCPRYSHPINESFLPRSLKFFIVSDNIKKNSLVF